MLQVSDVERNSSAHIGILQKQIDDIKRNVSQNSDTIDIVHTHLKVDVTNVNMSLQQQIDSVRKMEGPMVGRTAGLVFTSLTQIYIYCHLYH